MTDLFLNKPIHFLLKNFIDILKPDETVYLVGGIVRDLFLNRNLYDVDLAVKGNVRKITRRFADKIGAPFFMLNESFDTARIVWAISDHSKMYIDLVGLKDKTIEADLKARDFTINAMAIDIKNINQLIDPMQGRSDIQLNVIRSCSTKTFVEDPLRVLRAIRQSVLFGFHIENQTLADLKEAITTMSYVSNERLRDELFKVFDLKNPAIVLSLYKHLGIIPHVLPEIKELLFCRTPNEGKGTVWEHTLFTIKNISILFDFLVGVYRKEGAGDLLTGKAVLQLGRYRDEMQAYSQETLSGDRNKKALLFYCALFHNVGKKQAETFHENGSVFHRGHAHLACKVSEKAASRLALSNVEIKWTAAIIKNHMGIHRAAKESGDVDRRWLYRFIKTNQDAGIGLVFFSLADCLAHQYDLGFEVRYQKELHVCRKIFDAYFGEDDRLRNPPRYLNGKQIMALTQLDAGPSLGEVIKKLEEETAIGVIRSVQDAEDFVRQYK